MARNMKKEKTSTKFIINLDLNLSVDIIHCRVPVVNLKYSCSNHENINKAKVFAASTMHLKRVVLNVHIQLTRWICFSLTPSKACYEYVRLSVVNS